MSDGERPPKRTKTTAANSDGVPPTTVYIDPDGDAVVTVSGLASMAEPVDLRVSSHALSLNSPVLKHLFQTCERTTIIYDDENDDSQASSKVRALDLLDDNGDAVYLLCNALHLRNDKLPVRLQMEPFLKLVALAKKYECTAALSRCAYQWFDDLFTTTKPAGPIALLSLIEAAQTLNDPTWFSRLTSHSISTLSNPNSQLLQMLVPQNKFAAPLLEQHKTHLAVLRDEIDLLVTPLAAVLSSDLEHHPDCPPPASLNPPPPGPNNTTAEICLADREAAMIFLGALRDADVWPNTVWPPTLRELVNKLEGFRVPEYDSSDECEFCEIIWKGFDEKVVGMKEGLRRRLWGLCLDCFEGKEGECRVECGKGRNGAGF